ncbi:MAG: ABC transporter ATP-binding protein [Acidobacteriota bacterium]|nr:ABC transporter ATP-binding protein [Blastocatellia bacterium]MDW8240724.1 ABC transporter ATP-binding protein [Acidobacteriota bacterium]
MIEVSNLTKWYGSLLAVNAVSFRVERGEILGYLGPNGAGKSTTVKMLTGILSPSSGTILIDGQDLTTNPLAVKQRMGYVPEAGGLYESLTAYEFLQLVGRLYHLPEPLLEWRAQQLCRLFGLEAFQHERLSGLSKGMKQKVLLSAALIHNPDILFLDEPLSGLDATTMLIIKELLSQLAARGKTIFYCSHVLDVVERICRRVVILDRGRIIADAPVEQLKEVTAQQSLEGVFSQLTEATDASQVARALTEIIAGEAGP